jgi:hypothetical protein
MARRRPAATLLAAARQAGALSLTVTDTECIHEFVPYEGDTVSGNFVVVDHDIFWGSDHPGIDLTVPPRSQPPPLALSLRDRDSGGFMGCFLLAIWRVGSFNRGSSGLVTRDPLARSVPNLFVLASWWVQI